MPELVFSSGGERLDALFLPPGRAAPLPSRAWCGRRHAARFHGSDRRALAEEGVATFRYQFPYTQAGRRRPDSPATLHATVRAASAAAQEAAPDLPLIAGGNSMGGRMTTQAQADAPLPGVRGIALLGSQWRTGEAR